MVEQARAVARLEEAVGATSEQEQLFERVERLVDAAGRREGAVIIALRPPRAAMLLDAGVSVIGAQQDEGEAFVVARSEEHTSELQSLMRISYAVFCLKKNKKSRHDMHTTMRHSTPST